MNQSSIHYQSTLSMMLHEQENIHMLLKNTVHASHCLLIRLSCPQTSQSSSLSLCWIPGRSAQYISQTAHFPGRISTCVIYFPETPSRGTISNLIASIPLLPNLYESILRLQLVYFLTVSSSISVYFNIFVGLGVLLVHHLDLNQISHGFDH